MTPLTVDPSALFKLALFSILHGGAAAWADVAVSVALRPRLLVDLKGVPLRSYAHKFARGKCENEKKGAKIATFLTDLALCLYFACTLILLNFIFNNGRFRLFSAILSAASCFAARKLFGTVFAVFSAWLGFLLLRFAALIVLPPKFLIRCLRRAFAPVVAAAKRGVRALRSRRRKKSLQLRIRRAGEDGLLANFSPHTYDRGDDASKKLKKQNSAHIRRKYEKDKIGIRRKRRNAAEQSGDDS